MKTAAGRVGREKTGEGFGKGSCGKRRPSLVLQQKVVREGNGPPGMSGSDL